MAREDASHPSRRRGAQTWPPGSGCAGSCRALTPGWGALSTGVRRRGTGLNGSTAEAPPFWVAGHLALPFTDLSVGQTEARHPASAGTDDCSWKGEEQGSARAARVPEARRCHGAGTADPGGLPPGPACSRISPRAEEHPGCCKWPDLLFLRCDRHFIVCVSLRLVICCPAMALRLLPRLGGWDAWPLGAAWGAGVSSRSWPHCLCLPFGVSFEGCPRKDMPKS